LVMKNIWKIVIVVAVIALPLVFWGNIKNAFSPVKSENTQQAVSETNSDEDEENKKEKKGKKGKKDKKKKSESVSSELKVIDQWDLPSELTEISGLEFLGNNQFACIQDEAGTIFIYDAGKKSVIKKVPFSGTGDYEGIAIAGTTAYVVRSDGRIYEVNGYDQGKASVKEYSTPLTDHDVEGLCYDQKNNRLLIAIKGEEPGSKDYKGIYAFDLSSKKMARTPVYKIELANAIFADLNEKKLKNIIQPSDLEINPVSGEIYVIEGASPKVLIMDEKGSPKKLYQMSISDFKQAEGITFTPQGDLYISNEGKGGTANILKVEIDQ
jgi:uncharacterized protein YjiK